MRFSKLMALMLCFAFAFTATSTMVVAATVDDVPTAQEAPQTLDQVVNLVTPVADYQFVAVDAPELKSTAVHASQCKPQLRKGISYRGVTPRIAYRWKPIKIPLCR